MPTRAAVAVLSIFTLLLAGCGDPLPSDKREYAGQWTGAGVMLEIDPGGTIRYERQEGSASIKIDAPIIEFQGDDFIVGLWFMRTTFTVSEAPTWDGESWSMVVDGQRLTRTGGVPDALFSIDF